MPAQLINREKALIFRIAHRMTIAWIAENGLHCATSDVSDPNFISIGNADLIGRRRCKLGIKSWPNGAEAGRHKEAIFEDRLTDLTLWRLSPPGVVAR